MDGKPQLLGVVIRADGTVPFDADCDPNVRSAILGHLMDQGHTLAPVKDSPHVVIQGWASKQVDMPIQDAKDTLNPDGTSITAAAHIVVDEAGQAVFQKA